MDAFVVRANGPLSGTVRVCGATKNAGLKQMAAALLAPGVTVLRNLHPVLDLDAMLDVMRAIGASAEWTGENELTIDASGPLTPEAPYELVTRMRASINVLGPLLARCGEARVAMPGGDNIGSRKLDMHFRGLQAMGAELDIVHGLIEARCRTLCGARIVLDFPSVGATENLLTAAVLAKGQTVLDNAAREPEISDLAAFLNGMGAQISGAGASTIEVEGVESLTPLENEVMGARIEAATILLDGGGPGRGPALRRTRARPGRARRRRPRGRRARRRRRDPCPRSVPRRSRVSRSRRSAPGPRRRCPARPAHRLRTNEVPPVRGRRGRIGVLDPEPGPIHRPDSTCPPTPTLTRTTGTPASSRPSTQSGPRSRATVATSSSTASTPTAPSTSRWWGRAARARCR